MADVIIHGPPQSTYVRTTRMACQEKGVSYDLQPVAPGSEENLALHPFGKVPILQHGDLRLYETTAITKYIDAAFPGASLQPQDTVARARCDQWISAICDYFYSDMIHQWVLQYVFPRGADGQPNMDVIKPAVERSRRHLAVLNKDLAGRKFIAGDQVSLADLFVAPIMTYVGKMPEGPTVLEGLTNIHKTGEAMMGRASYQDTMPPPPPQQTEAAD